MSNDPMDDKIIDTLDYLVRALPGAIERPLDVLEDPRAGTRRKRTAREMILHQIGNLAVLAIAGLNHAVPEARIGDYQRIMRAFERVRKRMVQQSFEILPQIDHALALVRNPQLDK